REVNASCFRGREQRHFALSNESAGGRKTMTKSNISRRRFIEGGVGLTVANLVPGTTPLALAASMEERTVGAAKAAGASDATGVIWSPYLGPMEAVMPESN